MEMTMDTNPEEEYIQPERVEVRGPLSCTKHGRDCKFVFIYATKTYHHIHKNGGICSAPVEMKRW